MTEPTRKSNSGRPKSKVSLSDLPGPPPETPVEDVLLSVGIITGTHGVHGELRVKPVTDYPEHLKGISRVFVGDGRQAHAVEHMRLVRDMVVMKLEGVNSIPDAEPLRGEPVRISGGDAIQPAPGEFFYYQVIGLRVEDESGNQIGTVSDIVETGSNAVFVVQRADGSAPMLLPYLPDVVLDIDPALSRMIVRPLIYADE